MDNFAQQDPTLIIAIVVYSAIGICLITWGIILEKLISGRPVIPYQPRRRVPWQLWDLLAILLFFLAGSIIIGHLAENIFPDSGPNTPDRMQANQNTTAHPIVQVLAIKDWKILMLCAVVGIIIAPIGEELFFRVLVQGWLEKVDRSWRRRLPMLRPWIPLAVMPIFFSSLIFASQHFRKAAPPLDTEYLAFLLAGDGVVKLLTLILGLALVHWRVGATAVDLGWAPEKFFADVKLGLISFIAIIVPTFFLQYALNYVLSDRFAPDPITLFILAVGLGFIYYRTHRVTPLIVVHLALNLSSLTMARFGTG